MWEVVLGVESLRTEQERKYPLLSRAQQKIQQGRHILELYVRFLRFSRFWPLAALHPGSILGTDLIRHNYIPGLSYLVKPFEWALLTKTIPQVRKNNRKKRGGGRGAGGEGETKIYGLQVVVTMLKIQSSCKLQFVICTSRFIRLFLLCRALLRKCTWQLRLNSSELAESISPTATRRSLIPTPLTKRYYNPLLMNHEITMGILLK